MEANESFEGALAREFMEEFGVELSVDGVLLTARHSYPDIEINLVAMSARTEEAITSSTDHDRIEWVDLGELSGYSLSDADLAVLHYLQVRRAFLKAVLFKSNIWRIIIQMRYWRDDFVCFTK